MEDKTTFISAQLSFRVRDVKVSAEFYENVLNFKTKLYLDSPSEMAIIERDGVIIHLTKTFLDGEVIGRGCGFITVQGIDSLWKNLKTTDGILSDIETKECGMKTHFKEFVLRDMDGNVLRFIEPTLK